MTEPFSIICVRGYILQSLLHHATFALSVPLSGQFPLLIRVV